MRSRVVAAIVAGTLALGAGMAGAGSAVAATSDCPSGYSCVWRDKDWQTQGVGSRLFKFYECQANFSWVTYAGSPEWVVDNVTSVSNKGNYSSARYYLGYLYGGPSFQLARQTGDSNLADDVGHVPTRVYNDSLGSAKFDSATASCR